ncbi:MAG: glycosyltransferase family 4 protein [Pirellulales bacterium]|nr:glycosyltransferase family 4 protein [Pirellulales bacterium]
MMRVIYLHQYFKTPQMNGGTYSYEMARQLVARGHEVHMVTADCTGSSAAWHETEEAGIRVHWYPLLYSNHMSFKRRIRAFFQFAWAAARKAVTLPGDLVYASSSPLTIALPGVHVSRRKSIPMVFEVADLWPEMPIAVGALKSRPAIAAARWLERFAYRNAAHIVAFSPGMKAGIVATGYPEEKVTTIPNGCDLELFRADEAAGRAFRNRHPWLQDRPLVVYTGTMGLINGVDYLARLAAAVRVRDPEIRFLVVGTGREEAKVRSVAKELDVWQKSFFIHPPIPKTDMPPILSAADMATSVFLDVRQMWNNSASKVYDAMAAGRPIAINHEGWWADLIRQTECGLVLDPHDLEASADAMVAALHNRSWLTRAGAAARRVGEERFDRAKLAELWMSLLLDTAGFQERRKAA